MAKDAEKNSPSDAIDILKVAKECYEEINEAEKKLGHVNIIIAGKTGVGKSTLINAAFRANLAEEGMGMPVTQYTSLIEKADLPLRIYDTVGLELTEKTKNDTIQNIHQIIQDRIDEGDPDKFIHFMWYCVNSSSDRMEKPEQDLIQEISKKVPVILILTKAYLKEHAMAFAKVLKSYKLPVKKICIVLAKSYEENEFKIQAYGMREILLATSENLPQETKDAWINAQSDVELKNQRAMEIINQTIAASFAVGFIPIPLSDIAMLIPTEISMIARITNLYGLEFTRNKLRKILLIMFSATGAASAGFFLAKGLLKFIPGFGQTVGGAISGAAASAMTLTFGKTYIYIMEKIYTGEMSEDDINIENVREVMSGKIEVSTTGEIFKEEFLPMIPTTREPIKKNTLRQQKNTPDPKIDENFRSMVKEALKESTPKSRFSNILGGVFSRFRD